MKIPIQVEPAADATPTVEYRWDPDTEILSAQLHPRTADGAGMSGSVEVEGADGSWIILDVSSGRINSVEVAVWPDVRMRNALKPPGSVVDGSVVLQSRKKAGITAMEVETPMLAESDEAERIFHFTLGSPKKTRTVRFARDLLVDVDASNHLAGLWLLNVPPFPSQT